MSGLVQVDTTRLVRKLQELGTRGDRMAKAVIQSEADLMVVDAKRMAPANLGTLRQSIGKESINDGLIASVYVNVPYAAYVEFGTGQYVSIPPELSELAAKYKGRGNGSFEDFKIAIKDWMQRHGIEEKFAYVIMMQILHDGLHPQPFFYPAFQKMRSDLPKKLRLAFERLTTASNG